MNATRLWSFRLLRRIRFKRSDVKNIFAANRLPLYVTLHSRRHDLSRRLYSTFQVPIGSVPVEATRNLELREDHLLVTLEGGAFKVSYLWLRDHCRCPDCYIPDFDENCVEIGEVDSNIKPRHVEFQDGNICIIWIDDHVSNYSIDWLQDNAPGQRSPEIRKCKLRQFLWDKNKLLSHPPRDIHVDELRDGTGLRELLETFHTYGFAYVTGMEARTECTEEVGAFICPIMRTFFGQEIRNDAHEADLGYTSVALSNHTDNPYFCTPPGAVTLHCVKHTGTGGENTFVDGFHAAQRLKESSPEQYDTLLNLKVISHYRDKHRILRSQHTVLHEDTFTKELQQIRFNPHCRSTLSYMSYDDAAKYYAAYQALARLIESPDNQYRVKLPSDRMIVADNWRVLHGRTAITGDRIMATVYFSRDDLQSLKRMVANLDV